MSGTARPRSERAARPRKPAASAIESGAAERTSTPPASNGPASAPEFSNIAAIAFDEVSSAGVRISQGKIATCSGR